MKISTRLVAGALILGTGFCGLEAWRSGFVSAGKAMTSADNINTGPKESNGPAINDLRTSLATKRLASCLFSAAGGDADTLRFSLDQGGKADVTVWTYTGEWIDEKEPSTGRALMKISMTGSSPQTLRMDVDFGNHYGVPRFIVRDGSLFGELSGRGRWHTETNLFTGQTGHTSGTFGPYSSSSSKDAARQERERSMRDNEADRPVVARLLSIQKTAAQCFGSSL